jgi:hypothetical protein
MVFLDPASKLFVSHEAYGRDRGKKIASQVDFHVGLLIQISDLCQRLTKRPPPKGTPVGLNNFDLDFWNRDLHRQPFRIEFALNGMPEPDFDENDNIVLFA